MTKRITEARINRTTDAKELEEMFLNLTERMIDLRLYSRDLLNTLESPAYATLSIKAEMLIEKLQAIDPDVPEGDCRWTECNVGDFLC